MKSNAIVLAKNGDLVGVGAGQMSRVDSVHMAIRRAGERARGSVLASDAFFPFADGPEMALEAGVEAMIEPGGSVRDEEVIEAVDKAGGGARVHRRGTPFSALIGSPAGIVYEAVQRPAR